MELQFITTVRGSEDGFIMKRFEEGKVYDVASSLASTFLHRKQAVVVNPRSFKENFADIMADLKARRA